MEKQITKRQIIFIGIILLSLVCSFSYAQNCNPAKPCPNGYSCVNGLCKKIVYFCNCGLHSYGCGNNHSCINYCVSRCGLFANREIDDGSKLAGIYQSGSALAVNVFGKDQPDFLWNSGEKKGGIYVLQYETDCLGEIQKLSIK